MKMAPAAETLIAAFFLYLKRKKPPRVWVAYKAEDVFGGLIWPARNQLHLWQQLNAGIQLNR